MGSEETSLQPHFSVYRRPRRHAPPPPPLPVGPSSNAVGGHLGQAQPGQKDLRPLIGRCYDLSGDGNIKDEQIFREDMLRGASRMESKKYFHPNVSFQ